MSSKFLTYGLGSTSYCGICDKCYSTPTAVRLHNKLCENKIDTKLPGAGFYKTYKAGGERHKRELQMMNAMFDFTTTDSKDIGTPTMPASMSGASHKHGMRKSKDPKTSDEVLGYVDKKTNTLYLYID